MPYLGTSKLRIQRKTPRNFPKGKGVHRVSGARLVVSKIHPSSNFVSPSVKQYVRRAIAAASENKEPQPVSATDTAITPLTNAAAGWGTLISCADVWNISQGVGQGGRVGDKITPKKWNIRGYVHTNAAAAIPCVVKMFVFKQKLTYENPQGAAYSGPVDFFQYGSSSIGASNNYQDILRKVNEDKYTLMTSRVMKLGTAGSGTNTNNDFKCVVPFNINLLKYQGHKVCYNDTTSTPTNMGLYICFALAEYGGTTKTVWAAGEAPQVSYDIEAQYED